MDPSDNFNLYIREVTPLPIIWGTPEGSLAVCAKDENGDYVFAVTPDSRRKLRYVQRLPNLMKDKAAEFCNKHIPSSPRKISLVAYISLTPHFTGYPGMMSQKSTFFGTARPGSVFIYSPDEMTKAPNPVIKTLDAILGAVWPEKMNNHVWKSLSYPGPEEMPDRLLGNMWSIINTDTEYSKFIIFNMAEWTFDSKDIQPFLNIRVNFPTFDPRLPKPTFNRVEKIWGMIWDMCAAKNCPWFVLTNGEVWIFGVFVAGWSKVHLTDPIDRDSTTPSVLQGLLYWIASALELETSEVFQPSRNSLWDNPDVSYSSSRAVAQNPDDDGISNEEWLERHCPPGSFTFDGFSTCRVPNSLGNVFLTAPDEELAEMGWL